MDCLFYFHLSIVPVDHLVYFVETSYKEEYINTRKYSSVPRLAMTIYNGPSEINARRFYSMIYGMFVGNQMDWLVRRRSG